MPANNYFTKVQILQRALPPGPKPNWPRRFGHQSRVVFLVWTTDDFLWVSP